MRDGQATRRRLLDAATAEFAAHGIAGARVDRIAAEAQANKAQMYAYFGSKEGLFDAVIEEHLDLLVATVPSSGDDLPGYAVGLYDFYLERPELVRLATWARLERTPVGALFTSLDEAEADKVGAVVEGQQAGSVTASIDAAEIHRLVVALSATWGPASLTYTADRTEEEAVHQQRRHILAETVRRAFAP
ncbi:TetR family transcriptional regulator [Pseudonocardia xinjiangensis]|uniref:TetR family transcriptional regulator n=1 Tax=Pseudonocardia xinjiangensis TaxID=75289 RepID=UPI003D8E6400